MRTSERDYMANIDMDELHKLADEHTALTYGQLMPMLKLDIVNGGTAKQAQLAQLSRLCRYTKNGTRYTIEEVYDEPLSRSDGRVKWLPYVENNLFDYLHEVNQPSATATTKTLLFMAGLANENILYTAPYYTAALDFSFLPFNQNEMKSFVSEVVNVLSPILRSCLASLEKRQVIKVTPCFTYCLAGTEEPITVCRSDMMYDRLSLLVAESKYDMNLIDGVPPNKREDLYWWCNQRASSELGIDYFYSQRKIQLLKCEPTYTIDESIDYERLIMDKFKGCRSDLIDTFLSFEPAYNLLDFM